MSASPDKLVALADGELDPEEAAPLMTYIDGHSRTRAQVIGLRRSRQAINRAANAWRPPAAVSDQIRSRVKTRYERSWGAILAASSAVMLAVCVFYVVYEQRYAPLSANFQAQLIEHHIRFQRMAEPAVLETTDARKLHEWFQGKLGPAFELPQLQGTTLLGGRLTTIRGQETALMFYTSRGERVTVYGFPLKGMAERHALDRVRSGCARDATGYTLCSWPGARYLFVAVSRLEPSWIQGIAAAP